MFRSSCFSMFELERQQKVRREWIVCVNRSVLVFFDSLYLQTPTFNFDFLCLVYTKEPFVCFCLETWLNNDIYICIFDSLV